LRTASQRTQQFVPHLAVCTSYENLDRTVHAYTQPEHQAFVIPGSARR